MLWILKRYKVCFKSETYQSHLKWILTSGPGIITISQLILNLRQIEIIINLRHV